MKKAVRIKDIAEQLNLSRNTVAKALNGQYVPEKTRELVLNKAQELKYKSLDLINTSYENKKYKILLVEGKPLNNMNYYIPLIKSIENKCYERGYEFFRYTYNSSTTPFIKVHNYIKTLNADGIVAIECFDEDFITKLVNIGLPVCFNDFSPMDIQSKENFDIILVNDRQSVFNFVRALNSKYKITKFTFVGDNTHCRSFYERYYGMIMGILTFKGMHAKSDDILCKDSSFNYGNPNAIKTEILKLRTLPECFVCCNDFVARCVCDALKLLNIAVPSKILVLGFDNVNESISKEPYISSFSADKEFLGEETIRSLVTRIENPQTPSKVINVSATFIPRISTNKPTQN